MKKKVLKIYVEMKILYIYIIYEHMSYNSYHSVRYTSSDYTIAIKCIARHIITNIECNGMHSPSVDYKEILYPVMYQFQSNNLHILSLSFVKICFVLR